MCFSALTPPEPLLGQLPFPADTLWLITRQTQLISAVFMGNCQAGPRSVPWVPHPLLVTQLQLPCGEGCFEATFGSQDHHCTRTDRDKPRRFTKHTNLNTNSAPCRLWTPRWQIVACCKKATRHFSNASPKTTSSTTAFHRI